MVDTHAHLGLCEQKSGDLIAAARRMGVGRILTVGIEEDSSREAVRLAATHEEVFAAVGRHPNSATGFDEGDAETIESLAAEDGVVAVGETGFDYFRQRAPREDQRAAFRAQLGIARRLGLPVVVHIRDSRPGAGDALEDAFELLEADADGTPVILHCFSGRPRWAQRAGEHGWFCSFAGNVTYPKSEDLRQSAERVADDLLLVETDAPFLSPQPVRGKPNEPANVVATAERLAEVRGVEYSELDAQIESNASRVFSW